MSHDPEILNLAKLAHAFCKTAIQPIEAGHLPHLRLKEVVDGMWDDSNDELVRLWAHIADTLPGEKHCILNERMVQAMPRECLSIAEIFVRALRYSVTDAFLRRAIPADVPGNASSQFLSHAAPHLANVFHKPNQP